MRSIKPVNKAYCLHKLYESNYLKLRRIIPNLRAIRTNTPAFAEGKPILFIRIIETNPYTIILELSHCFRYDLATKFEPALKLRVYLDAQSVEVIRERDRGEPLANSRSPLDVLEQKWRLNYFLEKWLDHCLSLGYSLTPETSPEPLALS